MAKKKKKAPAPKINWMEKLEEAQALQEEVKENLASTQAAYAVLTEEPASDPYYTRDKVTGLSPAQVEARQALEEAAKAAENVGIEGVVAKPYGSAGTFIPKPEVPPADENFRYDYVWSGATVGVARNPGVGEWKLVQYPNYGPADWQFDSNGMLFHKGKAYTGVYQGVKYVDGKGPGYKEPGPNTVTKIPTGIDAATQELIKSLQAQIDALSAGNQKTAAAAKAQQDLEERQSAFDLLYAEMDSIGLAALVEPLRGLIQQNVSPSEFAVRLKQTEAYKNRFAANEVRFKKGLRVLQPGEYVRIEDAYRQTLRAYGLKQFDTDEYVRQFIENDISSAELSDRVSMAVQRVQNADPAIIRTLRDYYGIGQTDLVAYVLDPNQQLQKIQRQIAAAEIGTAARVQGLEAGVGVAEQLAAQGITQAQAQKGYSTIADILPTAEKLSQIYGATMEKYDMAQAEQEIFNQLASAQRRRERLTQREIATFSGQSGLARGGLSETQTRGQF